MILDGVKKIPHLTPVRKHVMSEDRPTHPSQRERPTPRSSCLPAGKRAAEEGLLEPDCIATVDRTSSQHGGIDTNVDLVVLGRRAQDTRIFR